MRILNTFSSKKLILAVPIVLIAAIFFFWYVGRVTVTENVSFTQESGESNREFPNTEEVVLSEETKTGEFTQQIYEQYLQGEAVSETLSQDEINSLIERINFLENIQIETYSLLDLTIIDSDEEALRQYQEEMAAVYPKHTHNNLGSEPDITSFALQTNRNKADTREILVASQQSYESMRNELLTMAVPREFSSRHLEVIGALNELSVAAQLFEGALFDPVLLLPATKIYSDAVITLSLLEQ